MNSLTVGELKELLEKYPNDMIVMSGSRSGDFWGRILADHITDEPEERYVEWSEYHGTYKQPSEPDFEKNLKVLIIGVVNDEQWVQ